MLDIVIFAVLPYIALTLALGVGLYRYFADRYSYSSQSSQFLESRELFWGSVPWHYGIILVLIGHIIGLAIPSGVTAFNSVPVRLYILEGTALALGLLALFGIVTLVFRRGVTPRLYVVTTPMDVVLLALLVFQVFVGVYVAIFDRWGSLWYVSNAVPYLRSIAGLSPEVGYVASLPLMIKLHILGAIAITAVFPFTRLVHVFTAPITYLWRPYQKVIWNSRPAQAGSAAENAVSPTRDSDRSDLQTDLRRG